MPAVKTPLALGEAFRLDAALQAIGAVCQIHTRVKHQFATLALHADVLVWVQSGTKTVRHAKGRHRCTAGRGEQGMGKKGRSRVEIVERGGMTIAGVLVQAPWQRLWDEVPKAWRQVFQRAPELQALQQGPFMDASLGRVDSAYLQLVGVRLREGAAVPRGFTAVHIPAQKLLRHRHVGPVVGIADSFGAMHAWARQHGVALGDFKLDFGYLPSGDETEHELLAGLLPEVAWRYAHAA